jgi:hypothetical protein
VGRMDTHKECQVEKQRRMDKALLYEAKSGQRKKRRRNYVKIQKLDHFSENFKEK